MLSNAVFYYYNNMHSRKILVLATALAALLALAAITVFLKRFGPNAIEVKAPIFGDLEAPIELVIFEDFKCPGCRLFSENVLPQLESEYLNSEKIRLKVIPLGFLHESKMLANAALEVYQLSPDQFLPYTKLIFERFAHVEVDAAAATLLIDLAKQLGDIDLYKLKACIDGGCHYPELERNLNQARSLMGKKVRIPALYVNGVRVGTDDYKEIQQAIERAQK